MIFASEYIIQVIMKLNPNSMTPLYIQLENIITSAIKDGTLTPGSRIPTEAYLQTKFDISRVTIRRAMKALTESGTIERHPGKGTFVSKRKIQRSISSILSFTEICRMQGLRASSKTLRMDVIDANEEEISLMHLKPNAKILLLERLRFADNIPVTIETSRLPEKFFFLLEEDLTDKSMYVILKKHGITLTNSSKTLEIVFANFKDAKLLNVPKNHPLLCITGQVTDNNNQVHLSKQLSVADKFKLFV